MTFDGPDQNPTIRFDAADNRIFVFASNRLGVHNSGAAQHARMFYGAVYGCGEGLRGRCYAIPTSKTPYIASPLEEVKAAVDRFLQFACDHPEYEFILTRIGCGPEGCNDREVAPMFRGIPANVHPPQSWVALLE